MAEFHNARRAPSKGTPGDVYWVNNAAEKTHDLYIAIADGTLVNLSDLINRAPNALAVGPKGDKGDQGIPGRDGINGSNGRAGQDGQSISGPKGERGERGIQGLPGKDGRDGKDGQSIIGPKGDRGDKGERGDVLFVGPEEMKAAVERARNDLIQYRARFHAAIADQIQHSSHLPHSIKQIVITRLREVERIVGS